ncbi:hypothetical protein AVEN_192240-1, partial [Araneus ventricosus]
RAAKYCKRGVGAAWGKYLRWSGSTKVGDQEGLVKVDNQPDYLQSNKNNTNVAAFLIVGQSTKEKNRKRKKWYGFEICHSCWGTGVDDALAGFILVPRLGWGDILFPLLAVEKVTSVLSTKDRLQNVPIN